MADEAFEEIGVSKGAAQLIKCRLQKTNQIEETFLKYVEHKFEAWNSSRISTTALKILQALPFGLNTDKNQK